MTNPDELAAEVVAARDAFLRELDRVEEASLTTPGLLGEWSGRELVAHLGYWAGHATEVIHAAETGRLDELGAGDPPTDEINATVVRVARETPMAVVARREAASVDALLDRLETLVPALLELRLPDGTTLEQAIREDSSDHYREHADALRAAFEGGARG
ncbi:MAG TPA: maleylpyruvate isomerase N-terminal domain-containing protein [Candidatus Limnocylindria bacterium]|nr:maleylpyruvate isomerase N-terminal domain-containing protein [Candidatus Limnocylindria bacterium]